MRAATLCRPAPIDDAPLDVGEVAEPAIGADDVLIDVLSCAVCRTDLQLCEGDLAAQQLPIIPGHQVVGVVSEIGERVVGLATGDRVGVAWVASTCGTCRFCTSGRENLCERAEFTGWHRHGGYAQQVVARWQFVYPLPAAFDPIDSAPLLCGGAIGLRALRVSAIEPGGRLGLFGFGASATCAIQIATHWGCEVHVCTRSVAEQRRAIDLGAVWAGGYDERPPVALDAAVTFAPVGSVVIAALQSLDRGGVVAINAIHLDRVPEFDYADLWLERQIRSVANVTRADVAELIDLAATIPIRTTVEAHPLEQVNLALQRLKRGDVSGAAVVAL